MAPLDFDNSINTVSLAGTWLGTIFTGLGLLAVFTQLRNLLLVIRVESRWKERAAGAWANCLLIDRLPSNGIQEGVVPIFSGWLQNFYIQEKILKVSQDDRGVSGKSSWSNLFARMDIDAADLVAYGGLTRQPTPRREHEIRGNSPHIRPLRPGLGDALVENGSISYGFSAAEFAALIIFCGFPPRDFKPQGSRHSASWYGQMLVADYGQFSQVAKFDSHHGFRDAFKSFKREMRDVPVAHSLNLAFGMIRAKGRHGRDWIIPCELTSSRRNLSPTEAWSAYPSPRQLQMIRYSFERFVGTSELTTTDYSQSNDLFEADDVLVMEDLLPPIENFSSLEASDGARRARARKVLNAMHAIAAIRPWALIPVIPEHMAVAIESILNQFCKMRASTVSILKRDLMEIPRKTFRPEGMTGEELHEHLGLLVGDGDNVFGDGENNYSATIYHESMSLVFLHRGIVMDEVRVSLAAAVGSRLFLGQDVDRDGAERLEPLQQNMRKYLERCYLQAEPNKDPRNVPDWAIDVYASYLYGWITKSIPADPDLINYFKRRVFLA